MSRHAECREKYQDIVTTQITNNNLKLKVESKRHKLFVNPVQCNVTYVWGLPSQERNSL